MQTCPENKTRQISVPKIDLIALLTGNQQEEDP